MSMYVNYRSKIAQIVCDSDTMNVMGVQVATSLSQSKSVSALSFPLIMIIVNGMKHSAQHTTSPADILYAYGSGIECNHHSARVHHLQWPDWLDMSRIFTACLYPSRVLILGRVYTAENVSLNKIGRNGDGVEPLLSSVRKFSVMLRTVTYGGRASLCSCCGG